MNNKNISKVDGFDSRSILQECNNLKCKSLLLITSVFALIFDRFLYLNILFTKYIRSRVFEWIGIIYFILYCNINSITIHATYSIFRQRIES